MTTIVIEDLRGVGHVELAFDSDSRVFTLFGSNGVGKTKCLEALYQLWLCGNDKLGEMYLSGDWAVMRRIHIDGQCVFDIAEPGNRLGSRNRGASHTRPVVMIGAAGRTSLASSNGREQHYIGSFAERQQRYLAGVENSLSKGTLAGVAPGGPVDEWFVLRAQSVNPYQKGADNRQVEIETVLEMLNALDERIYPRSLQVDGDGKVALQIEGEWRQLDELSSGFASLLTLMQAIVAGYAAFSDTPDLRDLPGIVLIDEIESHLHVRWQTSIIPVLKRLLPQTTFYVATHSPLVLAQLEEGEAYLLARNAEGRVCSEIIDSPDKRAFVDVLDSAFGVNLNSLKRESLKHADQRDAKGRLLDLLNKEQS